jgi:hypothetical protein
MLKLLPWREKNREERNKRRTKKVIETRREQRSK